MHMSQCIRRLFSKPRSQRVFPVEFANRPIRRTLHQEHTSAPETETEDPPPDDPSWTIPNLGNSPRQPDLNAREELLNTISFLLRPKAGNHYGLPSRPDGYLSIEKLLNYPMFRNMDIVYLQWLVNSDRRYRFQIKFDPGKLGGPWWVRFKPWDEVHHVLRPALLSNCNGVGVYKTTLKEWKSYISKSGIARMDQEYIRLTPFSPRRTYFEEFSDCKHIHIFLDIRACIVAGLRFYYECYTSQIRDPLNTPILTRGNHLGIIPPAFFRRVKLIDTQTKHLWGINKPFPIIPIPLDDEAYDEDGIRKTWLRPLERKPHTFVDFYGQNDLKSRPIHPNTLKEAEDVLSVT